MPKTDKQKLEDKIQKALRVNKAMAGKPGFDRFGAPTAATKRQIRDYYTKTGGKSILEVETPKKVLGPDEGGEGPRNKPKSDDVKTTKPTKPAKPRKTQKVSSSIKSVKSSKKQTLGDTAKLKTSKATAATLKDLGLKSKPKEEPKKQVSNKERRQLNRAANLALRSGRTLEEAKALKEKRRTARKDYLRNFASQLARAEQAAPRIGFGQGEGNPNANTSLVDNSTKGTDQEVKTNKEVQDSEATNILSMIDIGEPNKFLNDAFGMASYNSDTEDSTPINYMQKQYRKKRGY
jgi:hypothetical protein|tara:strand:+ start:314 stop:1189 length:876 start_codon:yes stop_codon:yes gene_type:complete